MARLIINAGESQAFVAELKPGVNYVGRSWLNHVQINHPSVSERHCEIIWEGPALRVRDLDSTNGTFVNQRPVREAVWVPGQMLQVGAVHIILEIPRVASRRQGEPAPSIAIPPLPKPETLESHLLADGSPACSHHHDLAAGWQCSQCERFYCEACLHEIRRVGGRPLKLCPMCSGRVQPVEPVPGRPAKKKGLLAFLSRVFGQRT